tara:strand:- start:957 stop:1646 length:690 start_codon:yes stop_codon:yes gene_type:complete
MRNIFIACDTSDPKKVNKIIKNSQFKIKGYRVGYKFGLEFFYSIKGRQFISKLKNKVIFLDLKLSDIGNTCAAAIKSLKDLKNINYLTVHANSGEATLKSVVRATRKYNKKIRVIAITVLTSISNANIKKIGHTKSIKDLVRKQTLLSKACGCHGIVCSGSETKFVKKIFKKEIIVPGIRLKGDSAGDQKRVSGPKEAFSNGATSIVIGRSVTKNNIRKNIKRLIKELK